MSSGITGSSSSSASAASLLNRLRRPGVPMSCAPQRASLQGEPDARGIELIGALLVVALDRTGRHPPSPDSPPPSLEEATRTPSARALGVLFCGDDAWCDRLCLAVSHHHERLKTRQPAL